LTRRKKKKKKTASFSVTVSAFIHATKKFLIKKKKQLDSFEIIFRINYSK